MVDRDPLDDLRAAWNEVVPPAPDHDSATDALVDDLRAVWRSVEAPVSDPRDLQLALRRRERSRSGRDRATLIAAAALLFALILVAVDAAPNAHRTEEHLAVGEPAPPIAAESPAHDPRVHSLSTAVRARALEGGKLELRHGRVRLLLGGDANTIIESPEQAAPSAEDTEEESE